MARKHTAGYFVYGIEPKVTFWRKVNLQDCQV